MTDSLYTDVGGHDTFVRLVTRFYEGVQSDPILRPMYPEEELSGAIWRLTAFLEQFFGGPTTYSEERGHPRLRARHNPYPVDDAARDRWLFHMTEAVNSLELSPLNRETMLDYFDRAAHAMVNTMSGVEGGGRSLL